MKPILMHISITNNYKAMLRYLGFAPLEREFRLVQTKTTLAFHTLLSVAVFTWDDHQSFKLNKKLSFIFERGI